MPFDLAWQELAEIEGGFSDDADDPGGATRYGITEAVAREHGYAGEMRDLPLALAKHIAKLAYWDVANLDAIELLSPRIAAELFECGYNCGVGVAVRFLQRALNGLNHPAGVIPDLKVDGNVGAKTMEMLVGLLQKRSKEGEVVLLSLLNAQQAERYLSLTESRAKSRKYLYGWVWRRVRL